MAAGDVKTLKDFFGILPGKTLSDFAAELKELSAEEKTQLVEGIKNETFTY